MVGQVPENHVKTHFGSVEFINDGGDWLLNLSRVAARPERFKTRQETKTFSQEYVDVACAPPW